MSHPEEAATTPSHLERGTLRSGRAAGVPTCPGLSSDVVDSTRRFWSQRTGQHVSDEDAREAIRNVSAFFDLLASWEDAANAEPDQNQPPECVHIGTTD
jgi:hypothetical protein